MERIAEHEREFEDIYEDYLRTHLGFAGARRADRFEGVVARRSDTADRARYVVVHTHYRWPGADVVLFGSGRRGGV